MRKLKPIPEFPSEAEERAFWATHDSTAYVDWATAQRVHFPTLKPSTRAISMRLRKCPGCSYSPRSCSHCSRLSRVPSRW